MQRRQNDRVANCRGVIECPMCLQRLQRLQRCARLDVQETRVKARLHRSVCLFVRGLLAERGGRLGCLDEVTSRRPPSHRTGTPPRPRPAADRRSPVTCQR